MTEDEADALAFLMGRDHPHLPNAYQRALVRVLRNDGPINNDLRQALANAIEPVGSSARQLVLRNRQRGNPARPIATALRDARLGRAVAEALSQANGQVESAVHVVMKREGRGRSTVMKAWEEWQRHRAEDLSNQK